MAKGYAVFVYHQVADADTMAAYARIALPALKAYGARFLTRAPGSAVTTREAGLAERVVVVEFPSKQIAVEAYDSAEYQRAFVLIASQVRRDVRFMDGTSGEPEG